MIKMWINRISTPPIEIPELFDAMQAEIDELRAALKAAESGPLSDEAFDIVTSENIALKAKLAALESQDARLKAELNDALATIELSGAEPANQPSQWGTVTLSMYQALRAERDTLKSRIEADMQSWYKLHYLMKKHGWHPGRTDHDLLDILEEKLDALAADAARWVYWRDYHGFSGYFDEGATASPESADIDAACDAAMKRVQP